MTGTPGTSTRRLRMAALVPLIALFLVSGLPVQPLDRYNR